MATQVPSDDTFRDAFDPADSGLLRVLIDTIIPEDEYPSASQSGGEAFLARVLTEDRPEWRSRLRRVLDLVTMTAIDAFHSPFAELGQDDAIRVLDRLESDDDYRWFSALVAEGYYADPASGGNHDAASWRMVGWRATPVGGWPATANAPAERNGLITPAGLAAHYDAIVIGSGAGGGVAADQLTKAGRRVLIVERGNWPDPADLSYDHLRNPRATFGFDVLSGPPSAGNPRTVQIAGRTLTVGPADWGWNNNAMTLGGGTRVYGAQAWRFTATDFRMASSYGVPEGSALADWPIGYDDLEPYYSRAEWEVGVSGTPTGDSTAQHRSREYPMPPLPETVSSRILGEGARQLGISTLPVPMLINSTHYDGRGPCVGCTQCVGFACPVDAKNGSHNTTLARALGSGLGSILVDTTAEGIVTNASGRVTGVRLVGESDGRIWRREVSADEVIVSAGAIESARLLLASRSDREPNGLGNNADQVGRHLQGHVYAGALGIFAEPIADLVGPGVSIATCDFRHGNAGIGGGGMIANEFVSTPASTHSYLRGAGLIPPHGIDAKHGMRDLASRFERVMGPIQEVTSAESRVRLDPAVRDRFDNPVALLSGSIHEEDLRAQRFMTERAAEWLRASGAVTVVENRPSNTGSGPSAGQHQAGSCRMGDDPKTSVVDPLGRVWGHENLRVVDGSVHVTNGGVNPVLTILANAYRIMDLMLTSGR